MWCGKPNHPHLWGVSQRRHKIYYEEGSEEMWYFSRVRRSKEDFENTSCFSVSTRGGGDGHKCFCRDISKSKHSKTVTQGSCHILLHSCYFPRLAHHVFWKKHTGKEERGNPRTLLPVPPYVPEPTARNSGMESGLSAILEEQIYKSVWSLKHKLVFMSKTSIVHYRKEQWNLWW